MKDVREMTNKELSAAIKRCRKFESLMAIVDEIEDRMMSVSTDSLKWVMMMGMLDRATAKMEAAA